MSLSDTIVRIVSGCVLSISLAHAHASAQLDLIGYKTQQPSGWKQEVPANNMRVAQFHVPGASGQEAGQSVVFYFGRAQGGSVEANIQRWESNFSGAKGKPVKAVVRKSKIGAAMPVTWAEMNGSYARGVGMGVAGEVKPDQTLLVAIVETPKGNLTFQIYGPKKSVAAQRKAFEGMVMGLR